MNKLIKNIPRHEDLTGLRIKYFSGWIRDKEDKFVEKRLEGTVIEDNKGYIVMAITKSVEEPYYPAGNVIELDKIDDLYERCFILEED